ncbi:MAG: TfuA-related McrA-glycine thioamidation protein [Methanoregulaceae archaeon]|nr:TfuA-related McrA-glycine thioamidation protein [Methanoregulaceae archaeon]
MRHEIVVFLGPSLDPEAAGRLLNADFRPPAKRGDIARAAADGARIITLIDGVFFQDCSVGHREILGALTEGVRVIGASSMGALRAAELDTLGMEGVGEIYRLYRDGILTSDDEVALVYDPETFLALSEPLINIRCTLRAAEKAGVLGPEGADLLEAIAVSLYFPDRTWETVCSDAGGRIPPDEMREFRDFLVTSAVDQKKNDAVRALMRTKELAEEPGIRE